MHAVWPNARKYLSVLSSIPKFYCSRAHNLHLVLAISRSEVVNDVLLLPLHTFVTGRGTSSDAFFSPVPVTNEDLLDWIRQLEPQFQARFKLAQKQRCQTLPANSHLFFYLNEHQVKFLHKAIMSGTKWSQADCDKGLKNETLLRHLTLWSFKRTCVTSAYRTCIATSLRKLQVWIWVAPGIPCVANVFGIRILIVLKSHRCQWVYQPAYNIYSLLRLSSC